MPHIFSRRDVRWAGVVAALAATAGGVGIFAGNPLSNASAATVAAPAATPQTPLWSTPNNGPSNTRVAASQITAANVGQLKIAWRTPITSSLKHSLVPGGQFGAFASTPIIGPGDIGYFQDAANNVWAENIDTGTVLWRHKYQRPNEGPNGLTLVNGVLYGTAATDAFALNAATGRELWHSGRLIDTAAQGRQALRGAAKQGVNVKGSPVGQGLNFAPVVAGGRVIVSTSGQPTGGVLYALSATTGRQLWKLQEVARPSGRNQGGALGTGGSWNAPAIGPDGTIYLGIGNPYRDNAQGINHPSRLLYDDSVIAVNPATGHVKWHFQAVPNDFYDWDLQASPILTTVGHRSVVVAGGKMGYVYVLDAGTGKPISRTPVGMHNGHDHDSVLALEHRFHPTYPYKVYPGDLGGIETDMAVAGGVAYASAVNDYQTRPNATSQLAGTQPLNTAGGDEVAVSLRTGKVLWSTRLPAPPFGAATVSNDLVFTTTFTGKVMAFSRATGKRVWTGTLPGGTNSPVVVQGNTLIAAQSLPGSGKPEVVAWQLPR